jgi:hypothetical protein
VDAGEFPVILYRNRNDWRAVIKKTLLILCSLLTGCATPETMQATGGSRSDGTVTLSYQYGLFQKPVVNVNQAYSTAKEKCALWGYSDAASFGGNVNLCQEFNGYGNCILTQVSVTYQCTGSPS